MSNKSFLKKWQEGPHTDNDQQQADPTNGRVIPTRETVKADLGQTLELFRKQCINKEGGIGFEEALHRLTTYVMQQKNDDYYRGVNLGLSIGRKEMVAAMETVIGEDDQVSEDPKNHNYHSNELRKEQRQRLKAMVGALEKGDKTLNGKDL